MHKNFNIVIKGVGGQGIITLVSLIVESAFLDKKEVRSSELHGLSQRGGSVEAHIRFGKNIYSPLVAKGKANLIIGLEITEALRGAVFANKDTKFLVNELYTAFSENLSKQGILDNLNKIANKNLILVLASDICKKELEKEVLSGVYLFGYAVYNGLIPIKEESALKAIDNLIPEKYKDLNIKAFKLSKHD